MSDTRRGTPAIGTSVRHRRYVPYSHAHYAGNLVDGAYVLGLFGDVATELSIRADGDEGLFASYDDVQFRAPVQAGDVLEVDATLVRVGRRSRGMAFEARVVCRGAATGEAISTASVLDPPLVVVTARGTVVVPPTVWTHDSEHDVSAELPPEAARCAGLNQQAPNPGST